VSWAIDLGMMLPAEGARFLARARTIRSQCADRAGLFDRGWAIRAASSLGH